MVNSRGGEWKMIRGKNYNNSDQHSSVVSDLPKKKRRGVRKYKPKYKRRR